MVAPIRMVGVLGVALASVSYRGWTSDSAWLAASAVKANPHTEAAGVLRSGVLTVTLEARPSLWYLDAPRRPAMTIEAFSELGKPPLMPAPLLRVPAGTELRLTVRNSLSNPLP